MDKPIPVQGYFLFIFFLVFQGCPQRVVLVPRQFQYARQSSKVCIKYYIEASAAANAKVPVTLRAFRKLQIAREVTLAQETESILQQMINNQHLCCINFSEAACFSCSVPTRLAYITVSEWCCPLSCSCLMKALCLYINSVFEWNIFQILHSSSGRDLWLVYWEANSPFPPCTSSAE